MLLLALGVAVLYGPGVRGFVLVFLAVRLRTRGPRRLSNGGLPLTPHFDRPLWATSWEPALRLRERDDHARLQIDTVMLEDARGQRVVRSPSWSGRTLVPRIQSYALIPPAAWASRPKWRALPRGSKYLLLAGLPIGAFGLLESDVRRDALRAHYARSAPPPALPRPHSCSSNFGGALALRQPLGLIVVVSTMTLVVSVALNRWLPGLGFIGAAWATAALYFLAGAVALACGYRAGWAGSRGVPWRTAAFAARSGWRGRGRGPASLVACAAYAAAVLGVGTERRN